MSVTRTVLGWLRRRRQRYWRAVNVADTPDDLEDFCVYLIGEGRNRWYAVFACPCGCDAPVSLSLHSAATPRWQCRHTVDGAVTLSPSVNRLGGCRSHFLIVGGFVHWV